MHVYVSCSTIHNSRDMKSTQMPISDKLDKEIRHINTMENYVAIKRNKIMSFAGTWMDLEAIILSKLMQEQRTQTPPVIIYKLELNNENTWTQGGEKHTLGPFGGCARVGRASGKMTNECWA